MADGKGIDFAAYTDGSVAGSTTSQTLDDYEEGTWTAGVVGTTPTSPNNLTNTTGYYTKIGRTVHVTWYSGAVNFTSSAGNAQISGLPFTATTSSHYYGLFTYVHGTALDGDTRGGYVNSTLLEFVDKDGTSSASFRDGGNYYIMVAGTYNV